MAGVNERTDETAPSLVPESLLPEYHHYCSNGNAGSSKSQSTPSPGYSIIAGVLVVWFVVCFALTSDLLSRRGQPRTSSDSEPTPGTGYSKHGGRGSLGNQFGIMPGTDLKSLRESWGNQLDQRIRYLEEALKAFEFDPPQAHRAEDSRALPVFLFLYAGVVILLRSMVTMYYRRLPYCSDSSSVVHHRASLSFLDRGLF